MYIMRFTVPSSYLHIGTKCLANTELCFWRSTL